MKKVLVQFEYKHWLVQPVTLLLLVLWVLILMLAVGNGKAEMQRQLQQHDSLLSLQQQKQAAHVEQMDSFSRGKKTIQAVWEDPTNAYMIGESHGKRYFLKQPLSLSFLSAGQSQLHHNVQTLSTSPDSWFMAMKKAAQLNNPHNTLFGKLDTNFVLLYLFPLLIIAFNFSILSAEKEDGRLSILSAQGLSVRELLWHKTGFRFIVITLLTLLVIAAGYFYYDISADTLSFNGIGYIATIIFYSAWWHALCVWVNLLKKGSDFNAGILFTSWIIFVMVIPALSTVLVTTVRPTRSKMQLMDAVRETLTEFDRKNAQILDAYYTDHPELVIKDSSKLMPVYMYKYMIKYKHTLEALQPVMDVYKKQALTQAHTAVYMSVLSPAMLLQETADEYSGNAQTQFLQFEASADMAVKDWNAYFTPKSLGNQQLSVAAFQQLPHPVFNNTLSGTKISYLIACMLVWLGVLCVLIKIRFKKYTLI